ncbi:uncharacterized protein LOC131068045 isoform X1 [Cryptomeria japonica]|uniref:uncharacterized protein LOC131068045 isoform X1 n=1 Tax=Cryptomeria japonica TaxID=3369 RepID=UPI0025AD74E5|nr:uncharacterized protein LOC131068045 isoform X1 [Cryptomeria japonica]
MKLEQEHRHGRNDDGGSCVVPVICRAEIDFYSCIVQISVYFSILLRYFMDVPNRFIVGKVPNLQQFGAICQYDQQTSKILFCSSGSHSQDCCGQIKQNLILICSSGTHSQDCWCEIKQNLNFILLKWISFTRLLSSDKTKYITLIFCSLSRKVDLIHKIVIVR